MKHLNNLRLEYLKTNTTAISFTTLNQQITPSSSSSIFSFEEISPIPKVQSPKVTRRRAAKQH